MHIAMNTLSDNQRLLMALQVFNKVNNDKGGV